MESQTLHILTPHCNSHYFASNVLVTNGFVLSSLLVCKYLLQGST